jgi:uncharacterized protein (TIGR00290 family)
MEKAILHWSGGKDAAMCLQKLKQKKEYDIQYLVTTFSKKHKRVSMHGIREELIEQQAKSIGIQLIKIWLPDNPSMKSYETEFTHVMKRLKNEGIEHSVFGDLFLQDIKNYRINLLKKIDVNCVFPLWGIPTHQLAHDFIRSGFRAKLIALSDNKMGKKFIGAEFDFAFLENLPERVDPCGENGEFHTFVYDGPIFNNSVDFTEGEVKLKNYSIENVDSKFWFFDLIPEKDG